MLDLYTSLIHSRLAMKGRNGGVQVVGVDSRFSSSIDFGRSKDWKIAVNMKGVAVWLGS